MIVQNQTNKSKEPLITLSHVSRTYVVKKGNGVPALQDVTLRIGEGEIIAVTGPSGSGKSTLLQILGGMDRPDSGEVFVADLPVHKLSGRKLAIYRNKTVGFVFQSFYLQPFLTVAKNIEIPLMFSHTKRSERAEKIQTALAAVGLQERSNYLPRQLSGGQAQRTAIARAVINNPRVILADEPTGNLDSHNSGEVIELLKQMRDKLGTTIVIVTHDATVAGKADRVIRIVDGRVVA